MKYKTLLFDADGTLLDFSAAELSALKKTLSSRGIEPTPELTSAFSAVNAGLWSRFERGEITKPEIIYSRFKDTLDRFSIPYSPEIGLESEYQARLADEHALLPNAETVCRTLSENFRMYIITNGLYTTQKKRLAECGLLPFFGGYFVSEKVGAQKPAAEYFNTVLREIGNPDKSELLIIGDSLSSDIRGGINSGIDTCWFNPKNLPAPTDISPTYSIAALPELYDILT